MSAVVQDVLAADDQWQELEQALGSSGYDEFYSWLTQEIAEGTVKRFYVYTRRGGQEIYSVPVGDTSLDAVLAYKPNPEHPLAWTWIVEKVVRHDDNKLAQLDVADLTILRTLGPWVRG